MRTNNNLIYNILLLIGGGIIGYLYKVQKDIDYQKTVTAASAGQKIYSGVTEIIDVFKKNK